MSIKLTAIQKQEIEKKLSMKDISIDDITLNDISYIEDIVIDATLPVEERKIQFILQVKNPFIFKTKRNVIIKQNYINEGRTLQQCLEHISAV